jgi:hypothetical protein
MPRCGCFDHNGLRRLSRDFPALSATFRRPIEREPAADAPAESVDIAGESDVPKNGRGFPPFPPFPPVLRFAPDGAGRHVASACAAGFEASLTAGLAI